MKILLTILKFVDNLNKWIAYAASPLLPAMVCLLAFETVARYLFNRPTIWVYDLSIFAFGYLGLLAGAYVHQLKGHVSVDIVYQRFSPRTKALLDGITGLVVFVFLILTIIYCWGPAIEALKRYETTISEWGPPVGHYKLLISVATFLLLLQALANWIRSLYRAITDKELKE
jgi:TRAP-type mannitol/chloroaromatic compound transport system permease small subunit